MRKTNLTLTDYLKRYRISLTRREWEYIDRNWSMEKHYPGVWFKIFSRKGIGTFY